MTELNARSSKQGNSTATGGDASIDHEGSGSLRVTGAARRTEEGGTSSGETGEPIQHPSRVDGSEDPDSGDAALENHESGVWNEEREAEGGGGNGLDDRDEKV